MMKRVILVMAAFMMLMGSVAWAADPLILKWATFEPLKGFGNDKVFMPYIEEFNKKYGDKVQFKFFPGGTLGKNPATYVKMVLDGVCDVGWIMNPYQPGRFIDEMVTSFPYLANNTIKPTIAAQAMHKKGMLRGYEDLHPIGMVTTNQVSLHTNFPVKSPADLKGKKIRASGKIQFAFLEALGATPVNISILEAAENMSRGVIEGAVCEPLAVTSFRIEDVAKHHALIPLGCVVIMATMSKEGYDKLPADIKAILDKEDGAISKRWAEQNDAITHTIIEKWQKDTTRTVFIPTPQQIEEWAKLTNPVLEAWLKENPKNPELMKAYKEELAK